jgi:MFS family permease
MDTAPPSPSAVAANAPTRSVYDRTFWLAYLANTSLVFANALTFRFAELVSFVGGTEKVAGDIVAVGLTIAVIVRLAASHVIDDYGTRRLWIVTTLLFITGCVMFLLAQSVSLELYVARTVFVVGLTGMFACSMTHIQNQVPLERRTEVIGNLGSSGFIGMILGANAGDWILRLIPAGRGQFLALFGLAAFIGIIYLAIVMEMTKGQRRPITHRPSPPAWKLLIRHWPGAVVVVGLVMGLGVTVNTVFLTRFATTRGIASLGMFFTAYALSAFVFRIQAAHWSRTIGRHWMLVRGLLGHTVGLALLATVTQGWQLILPAIVCGFGHALLFPGVVSLGSGSFPPESRGTGTATILGLVDFGSLVFSPILGRIIVNVGFEWMFLIASGCALLTAIGYSVVAWQYPDHEEVLAGAVTVGQR